MPAQTKLTVRLSKKLKQSIAAVKGKRAKAVLDHIIAHGMVTTEDLEKMGYAHAPRAARDVRENGIPLKTIRVKGASGKSIAAYTIDTTKEITGFKLGGRKIFPKTFKQILIEKYGPRCAICNEVYPELHLQIDHRVPYEVSGDDAELDPEKFMLLCATCNRKKSWTCEQCPNWLEKKDPEICKSCAWANPENFLHIAMQDVRRVEVVWKEQDVKTYDSLKKQAQKNGLSVQDYIKSVLAEKGRDI